MGLVQGVSVESDGQKGIFYWPGTPNAVERPFHHRRLLDLPSQRADLLSVLLTISEVTAVLDEIRKLS
jgi:hypothetical protein